MASETSTNLQFSTSATRWGLAALSCSILYKPMSKSVNCINCSTTASQELTEIAWSHVLSQYAPSYDFYAQVDLCLFRSPVLSPIPQVGWGHKNERDNSWSFWGDQAIPWNPKTWNTSWNTCATNFLKKCSPFWNTGFKMSDFPRGNRLWEASGAAHLRSWGKFKNLTISIILESNHMYI